MALAATPVPPLGPEHLLLLLLQLSALLIGAVFLGRLASRFGLPAVVGELLTGVVLGPSVLGQAAPGLYGWLLPAEAEQFHLLDAVAQLSVLLLVGLTGMHLDLGVIRQRGRVALGVSAGGLVVPVGLGLGLGYLLPASLMGTGVDRAVFALFVAVAMGVSAIPVIAKTLSDLKMLHRNVGQLTLTVATVDDAVAWLLLSIGAGAATAGFSGWQVARSASLSLLVVPLAALALRPVVKWVLTRATRSPEPGTPGAVAVVVVLLCGAGTHALGLEPVLGAFVGGILVGSVRAVPRERFAPFRTFVLAVLAPLFLASIGLRMDLTALLRPEVALAAAVVTAIAVLGKFAGAYAGARAGRLGHREGLALGAGLNARGAVEAVVAMVGLKLGVFNTASYTVVILVALVTSLMTPPVLRWAMAGIPVTPEELAREARAAWATPAPVKAAADGVPTREQP